MIFIVVSQVDRWQNFLALVGAVMDHLPANERGILKYSIKYLLLAPREDRPGKRTCWMDLRRRTGFINENDPYLDSPERFARLLYAFALKVADERSARWPKKFAKQWTALIGPDVPVRAEDGKLTGFDHLRAWINPEESEPVPPPEIASSS